MKSMNELDRVFPLSGGSSERPALHAPRLAASIPAQPGIVLDHSALMRAWAARRAKIAADMVTAENLRVSAPSLR